MAATGQSSGDSNAFAALSYLFGIVIALVIYFVKKEDPFVRYHAMQAILLDIVVMAASFALSGLLLIGTFALGFANPALGFFAMFWGIWLGLMAFAGIVFLIKLFFAYKAYTGSRFKLPLLGREAEKMAAG